MHGLGVSNCWPRLGSYCSSDLRTPPLAPASTATGGKPPRTRDRGGLESTAVIPQLKPVGQCQAWRSEDRRSHDTKGDPSRVAGTKCGNTAVEASENSQGVTHQPEPQDQVTPGHRSKSPKQRNKVPVSFTATRLILSLDPPRSSGGPTANAAWRWDRDANPLSSRGARGGVAASEGERLRRLDGDPRRRYPESDPQVIGRWWGGPRVACGPRANGYPGGSQPNGWTPAGCR